MKLARQLRIDYLSGFFADSQIQFVKIKSKSIGGRNDREGAKILYPQFIALFRLKQRRIGVDFFLPLPCGLNDIAKVVVLRGPA